MSSCNYSLGFKAIFSLIFTEFELTTESRKHKKMTCSYNDNYFSERLTFEICHLQLISSYTQICSLLSKKKTRRTITNVCVWFDGRHYIFLWFVYILLLEMTLKEGAENVPLLESDWSIQNVGINK